MVMTELTKIERLVSYFTHCHVNVCNGKSLCCAVFGFPRIPMQLSLTKSPNFFGLVKPIKLTLKITSYMWLQHVKVKIMSTTCISKGCYYPYKNFYVYGTWIWAFAESNLSTSFLVLQTVKKSQRAS